MPRLLFILVLLGARVASGAVFNVPGSGGGTLSGSITGAYSFNGPFTVLNGTNVFQPAVITNIHGTGVITNAPWTTNLAVGYNLGMAISNLPNNSVANILPGTHTVTPVITFTNGAMRFPPITIKDKSNITLNVIGTIDGSSALGEIMLITNSSRITINGHNSGVFIGSRQTNIATLIPTNCTWGLIDFYHCSDLTFRNFSLSNAHYHGIADWGGGLGSIASTNNILFDNLDIRWCGSKMTNNPISWDGAAIVLSGGTVRNCYFRDNFRAVEVYTFPGNILTDNTIIENNRIYDTLDCPITTSGSTNNNKIQVFNNYVYQTKGYTRHGTNYLAVSAGALIRLDGGYGHKISFNKVFATNNTAIYVGGQAGAGIETTDNYIDGPITPIVYGADAILQGQHRYPVIRGNTALNVGGGYIFNACRDGLVALNKVSEFRIASAIGFSFYPTQPNTNMFVVDNVVKDTSGNQFVAYYVYAGNDRIIFSNNDGTNGTSSFITDATSGGLIYRGQRNNEGEIAFTGGETTEMYRSQWQGTSDFPIEFGAYGAGAGFSNVNTSLLEFYNPDLTASTWTFARPYSLGGFALDTWGSGSPEGAVTANVGSIYHQTNGSGNSSIYFKTNGTGNTGWWLVTGGGAGSASAGGATPMIQMNMGGVLVGTTNLIYDVTNSRVGLGTTTPRADLEVTSASLIGLRVSTTGPAGTNQITSSQYQNLLSSVILAPRRNDTTVMYYSFDTNAVAPNANNSADIGGIVNQFRHAYLAGTMTASNTITTNLQVTGGTLGAGKVLTDAAGDGKAVWTTPSSGLTNFAPYTGGEFMQTLPSKLARMDRLSNEVAQIIYLTDSFGVNDSWYPNFLSNMRNQYGNAGAGWSPAWTAISYTNTEASPTVTGGTGSNKDASSPGWERFQTVSDGDRVTFATNTFKSVRIQWVSRFGGDIAVYTNGVLHSTMASAVNDELLSSNITFAAEMPMSLMLMATNGGNGYISGVSFQNSRPGMLIHNWALDGLEANNIGTAGTNAIQHTATNYNPDAWFIDLGQNDLDLGNYATLNDNLTRLVNAIRWRQTNVDIVFVARNDVAITNGGFYMLHVRSNILAVAQANQCGFIDEYSRFGSYQKSLQLGYMLNTKHINSLGGIAYSANQCEWIRNKGFSITPDLVLSRAGSGSSNYVAGGRVFHKIYTSPFTNLNTTIATFTNGAQFILPAYTLANEGDSVIVTWKGKFIAGTNNVKLDCGYETVLDTGTFTNAATAWDAGYQLTRGVGPIGNHADAWFNFSQVTPTLTSAALTGYRANLELNTTNITDVTNVIRFASNRAGGISNNVIEVQWIPASRGSR